MRYLIGLAGIFVILAIAVLLSSNRRAIRLRVLARAVGLLGGAPRGGALAQLDDALVQGSAANCGGVAGRSTPEGWLLEPEPPRRG